MNMETEGEEALTHVDSAGKARMVDVSEKSVTVRQATASAVVALSAEADRLLRKGELPKGSVGELVRLAAIGGAKQTSHLIPLCHPLRVTRIDTDLVDLGGARWEVRATVRAVDRTGVEMEAMTAAAVGSLALYDMVKAVDRNASIEQVRLLAKSGGKSGDWVRDSD